jgi:hypothetical protein
VVESPRRERRLLGGRQSFAMRLLKAGARELIVFATKDEPPDAPKRYG